MKNLSNNYFRQGLSQNELFGQYSILHNSHSYVGCDEQNREASSSHSLILRTSTSPQIYLSSSDSNNYLPEVHRRETYEHKKARNHLVSVQQSCSSSAKKTSPQFRWRRRKRRSKAQYPEMSKYLMPIDDGEEVQHLVIQIFSKFIASLLLYVFRVEH